MLQVAFSDHQVTNHAAEVEARTIGAPIMTPGLARRTSLGDGALFHDDRGVSVPRLGAGLLGQREHHPAQREHPGDNLELRRNGDPHSHPTNEPAAGWQEAQFLLTGWMVDVCGGQPYLTLRHPANGGTPSCRPPTWAPGSRTR